MKTEKLFTVNKYKISVLLLAFVFAIGTVVTAGVSTPDVDIGSSGIQINSGTLDVNGNDIEDAGTTIWDQNNGYIPSSQIQDNFLLNTGDSLNNDDLTDVRGIAAGSNFDGSLINDNIQIASLENSGAEVQIAANGDIPLTADVDGSAYKCTLTQDDGSLDCDGTKNWVHELNNTHESFYTSQESPEVRAVFEGQTTVTDSKKVELPSHFSKTVSDTEPKMRTQVTPRGTLTNAAAMKVTDDYIKIKVGEETQVDYRVTGIREGYEDKEVVREKQ